LDSSNADSNAYVVSSKVPDAFRIFSKMPISGLADIKPAVKNNKSDNLIFFITIIPLVV
jgi:hypothetical protein